MHRVRCTALLRAMERWECTRRDVVDSRVHHLIDPTEDPMRHVPLVPRVIALASVALAALAVVACTDTLPPTAPGAPEAAVLRGAEVRDATIRRDDSHFTARIRISRRDENTAGASLRLSAPDANVQLAAPSSETIYVEGGYGAAGEIHFGVYWAAVNPSFAYAGMRAIGDRVELLDAAGQIVSSQPFDAQMAEAGLPGGTLVGAFFPFGEPGLLTCPPNDPLCGASPELRDASSQTAAPLGSTREVRRIHRPVPARGLRVAAEDGSEIVRLYRKVADDAWRLEELRHTEQVTTDRGPRVTLTVMQVTYGAWHRNAVRDAARAAVPSVGAGVARAQQARATDVLPAAPSADAAFIAQLCARGSQNVDLVRSKSTKGLAILYQHGFCSDASTWDGMRPRLSSTFTVQRERAFSLATTQRAEAQVDELIQRLRAAGVRPNLVIGHSLGGLLARRLGQRDSALVNGVITIGSPHLGALGADIAPDFAADILAGAIGNLCVGEWLCQAIAQLLLERDSGRLHFGVPGLVPPVFEDLATGSAFLQTLNSAREAFPRAGIEVNAGNRWALFRMIGDARSPRTALLAGMRPVGHEWVRTAEKVYSSALFLQMVSVFMRFQIEPYGGGVDCRQSGYAAYWTPCVDYDWDAARDIPWYQDFLSSLIYQLSTMVIRTMNFIDVSWDWITTRRGDHTDGLVALRSQRYPASPGVHEPRRVLITPPDAESHAGETASPRVVDRTIDLVRAFGLGGQ